LGSERLSARDVARELASDIAGLVRDPYGYVMYAFPWGAGELEGEKGPDVWQREILECVGSGLANVNQALQIAVASGHDIGKAQPKSLIFETPDGMREWGDIKVGDRVFGVNGEITEVIAVHEKGVRQVYEVSFDDGSSTLCCEDHIWTVRGRSQRRMDRFGGKKGNWIQKTTRELIDYGVTRPNGVLRARQWELPLSGAVEFDNNYSIDIDPYVLGLWLGDGGRESGRITTNDEDVLSQLKFRNINYSTGRKNGTDALSITIYGLKVKLRELGILDKYSYEKSVPDSYKYSDSNIRAEVLRGLLDTDGESNKYGAILFSSTSKCLAEDIIWLVRSLGGKARISPKVKRPYYTNGNGERVEGRICYRVFIAMPHDFQSFYVKRKQDRVINVRGRSLHKWISSIEPVSEEDCMCITINKKDGLYLTNDFIVTHNSALVSWLILWSMSTCVDCKGVVTANTEVQLRTKTWSELAKWHRLAINGHWFKLTATALFRDDALHEKTWRVDQVPWSETNTEAFAGMHNKGKRVLMIFDEASAIPDVIWEVSEGAMLDEDTELIWAVFGNPTRNTGRFKDCFGKYRHRWLTRQIDSRNCKVSNKKKIQEWIEDYGIDSDFVKVRVRGMFPAMSAKQYISVEDVDKAFGKSLRPDQYRFAPKILAVDPAWSGDDEMVIGLRQGLAFSILRTIPKNDNDFQVASLIASLQDEHKADAVFIDAGYGTGIVSAGRTMGRNWRLVWFSEKSNDKGCVNKRAEMWKLMKEWLKDGGAIPGDHVLYQDLIGPETIFRSDGKVHLESKEDMKRRGISSPNRADCLAISFAFPVQSTMPNVGVMAKLNKEMNDEWNIWEYLNS